MRRFALLAVIAAATPGAAGAQACLGSVSFATAPVRLGGGAILGKDYTAYAAALVAGKDNAAFGDVGFSRAYYDDFDDTSDEVFAEVGYQRTLGARGQLCPVVGAALASGPDDAGELKSRFASAGLAVGVTLQPAPSVKVIPNGAVRFEYATTDFTDPNTGKESSTDNSGLVNLGLGLTFFHDRLAIQPTVHLPFASDDNDVFYGLTLSIGFAIRR